MARISILVKPIRFKWWIWAAITRCPNNRCGPLSNLFCCCWHLSWQNFVLFQVPNFGRQFELLAIFRFRIRRVSQKEFFFFDAIARVSLSSATRWSTRRQKIKQIWLAKESLAFQISLDQYCLNYKVFNMISSNIISPMIIIIIIGHHLYKWTSLSESAW